MSATTTRTTPPPPTVTGPVIDIDGMLRDIEQYLAARTRTTAHPLVTKTTQQLIDEALGAPAPAAPMAVMELPGRLLRLLPDWVLSIPAVRHRHGNRPVTVTEHLELTALVIERYGWTQGKHRTRSGRACILGAQAVLFRLGIGDQSTVDRAGQRLQAVLRNRGCTLAYHRWNDMPDRTAAEVVALVWAAARAEATR
ncbi:hypothetical protein H8R03_18275 [Streptomyces sp. JH010]|uniref:DUF6197 family protein n=1 Tax=unclassified Streptomyces TaxID=2593676 RepID=UPI0022763924|nr:MULTISPECIES: hypothetical protein [unclassified Streptomyces]MCY1652867.1 hypothetical protein [Streptomyces sp. SL203]MCY1679914.1 hypothetical protein [Streptomyces sp. SL294]MDF6063871.1 hypothetical protein [Streptomyces sp. JH010]